MKVKTHFHVPVALLRAKVTPVPIEYESGRDSKLVWKQQMKISRSCLGMKPDSSATQLVA
jgi:hypothetical protein